MCSLSPKEDSSLSVKQPPLHTQSPSAASLCTSVFSQNSQQVLYNTGYSNKQVSRKRNFKFGSISRSEKQAEDELKIQRNIKNIRNMEMQPKHLEGKKGDPSTNYQSNYSKCTSETKGNFTNTLKNWLIILAEELYSELLNVFDN